MKKIALKTALYMTMTGVALIPAVSFADYTAFAGRLGTVYWILLRLSQTFMGLATVVFIWGLITYITAGGSEDKIVKGRKYMLWGIIGLTVMVAIWGIVLIINNTFNIGGLQDVVPTGVGSIT